MKTYYYCALYGCHNIVLGFGKLCKTHQKEYDGLDR
ncbi:hypothetical protein LCGC14_0409800 [marine sediment metagenome]|uniref:Uncharacterized protein n=1 Tax=marine sediment metagenome TaxID=412755 RepID=A0A0F9VG29_9ZZZZ